MTSWTFDVYQAKSVQGRTLTAAEARASCNPKVAIEYAGEKLCTSTQVNNTRDPTWNDTLKAESRESISRGRFRLTFKVTHKPEWAGPDSAHTLSYATVFVSNDNSREFRRKLMLKSDITHEENGGWIEVGWHGTDVYRKERDEAAAKAAMLRSMGSKWSVGDRIMARDDDTQAWKRGIVQELAPDGTPRVKLEKVPQKAEPKPADKESKEKVEKKEEVKGKEKEKEADAKEKREEKEDAKDTKSKGDAKEEANKDNQPAQSAKLLPGHPLAHLINLGPTGTGNVIDAELAKLQAAKDAAVAAEKYTEAQALKEQIEAYKSMKRSQNGGWRAEAPVSSLVRACRRIDFESGKCIEAGTLGEVIGGLVRMGSALFTPTPGDVECYGVSLPQDTRRPNTVEAIPIRSLSPPTAAPMLPPVPPGYPPGGDYISWNGNPQQQQQQLPLADMTVVVIPQAEPWAEIVLKHLHPSDTVATVKGRIQSLSGAPTAHQCLSQQTVDDRRRRLDDKRTLGSYHIKSGDTLTLTNSTGLVHVAVAVENRHKVRIAVPQNTSVVSLKQRLAEKENIPVSRQVIELDGTELQDSASISSYGVGSDTVLAMYERHGQGQVALRSATPRSRMKLTVIAETATLFKTLTIDCKGEETVGGIKHRLRHQGGLQGLVSLKFEDQQLSDGYQLQEYGIQDGSVITASAAPEVPTPLHTTEVDSLRDEVKQLQALVRMMQPTLPDATPSTDQVVAHSKALRTVAETEVARASTQLAQLDHPIPRSLTSPPRSRPDITATERFRQMQKIVAKRST